MNQIKGASLLELAERLERLTSASDSNAGPVRGLEIEIHDTVSGRETYNCGGDGQRGIPRYLRSLDAAMTLVPEGFRLFSLGEARYMTRSPAFSAQLEIWTSENGIDGSTNCSIGVAATPALALCAAALRARARP